METGRDRLYDRPGPVAPFAFDAAVAEVFPDMISRSVPGYAAQLELLGILGARYLQAHSRLYDLGCSWGAASRAVLSRSTAPARVIGVDKSAEMIAKATAQPVPRSDLVFDWRTGDIADTLLEPCSVILLHYTLQFVPLERRLEVLRRCWEALLPGGALLLSEKTRADDPAEDERLEALLALYKRAHGYTEREIANKRQALDAILVPETVAIHRRRLLSAGFPDVTEWFRSLAFVGLLAVKTEG
ncbi:MAG: methyltransferase domain-containing protein [Opitutales bacterium]